LKSWIRPWNDRCGVAPLKLNGLAFSDSTTKANIVLNSQFSSVFTSEDLSNMPDMGVGSTPEIPPIIIHHNDVMKLLTSLNPHKATGPDSILARLLKETAKEITPALTFIFQASINQGKIPSDWKTAIVAPVFKNGDRGQPSNYMCPIALCGFKLVKSFMTSLWWIIIGGISGVELTPISGMLLRSSDVKTDEN
jgi:hypothetical protein